MSEGGTGEAESQYNAEGRSAVRCECMQVFGHGDGAYTSAQQAAVPESSGTLLTPPYPVPTLTAPPPPSPLPALLRSFSMQELRQHAWRSAAACGAVMLGVALAFAVHLINASALSEFASAVRAVNGQPDLELRAANGRFAESAYAIVANHPDVALASPVLEISTMVVLADGSRKPIKVLGLDALVAGEITPGLMPMPMPMPMPSSTPASAGGAADTSGTDPRFVLFAPNRVFLNAGASQLATGERLQLQAGLQLRSVSVAGTVSAQGGAIAVMDIGAAQDLFGRTGELTRIDTRLRAGVRVDAFMQGLRAHPAWPPEVHADTPEAAGHRLAELSRAYRVNLLALAMVALFTGAFLVFSMLSLSVHRRAPQFALLGVLGLTPRERMHLVLGESALLGLLGSALGIALGTGLAALALRLLGGDLGGAYFGTNRPALQWHLAGALLYLGLGVMAALVGGWWPARHAQGLALAQTLKGLGSASQPGHWQRFGVLIMLLGVGLSFAPPIWGLPVAAYVAVALLLLGGIATLPALVGWLLNLLAARANRRALTMLVVERARRVRASAAVAVSGGVASLALAVALTVMVGSFRDSVAHWLDTVVPADLYVRTATSSSAGDTLFFTPAFAQEVAAIGGVRSVSTQRNLPLLLATDKPTVALLARTLNNPQQDLPLVGELHPVAAGQVPIYVSEAMVDLHQARLGAPFVPLTTALDPALGTLPGSTGTVFVVAGIWRDYVRQFGSIAMDSQDFARITGDQRINELALSLHRGPGAPPPEQIEKAVRALAAAHSGGGNLIEMASATQLRDLSMRIFDRSFAVTYWLQAVAIVIGLFGVAASFSAQVLARRREFGLLAHLGLTRRQILTVVAGEGAAWTSIGAVAGLGLGLAVSVVLIHVINPQSFHWTMDMSIPWLRLLGLCAAVVIAGTLTAWLAARAAAGRDAVMAVKEDW